MGGFVFVVVLGLIAGSLAAPTFPETANTDDCPTNESIKSFPHPTDCTKYYQCENGTKVEMNCTHGWHYNANLKVCDFPKYARCNVSGSTTVTATTSTQSPLNETAIRNNTRASVGKEELKSKLEQKISERNNTLGANDTGSARNINTSLVTNGPGTSRNENITLIRIWGDSKSRNSSSNNTVTSNTTRPVTNATLKENLGPATERAISLRNDSSVLHISNRTNNSSYTATTQINEEETTENTSETVTESSTGKAIIQKMNVTNSRDLKIANNKHDDENESGDNEEDEESEEDKKEHEKP